MPVNPTALVKTKRGKSAAVLVAVLLAVLFSASDCDDPENPPGSGAVAENKTRTSNYDRLVKSQPALTMDYSPTRDTKNFWIKTWGAKGKVSYVYLLSEGKPWAFAVIKRLPVTYCVSMVKPTEERTFDFGTDAGGALSVPAPSIDGTYGSGSNCTSYYGEDATTGAYVEWTVGADTTMLLRDQPLPLNLYQDAIPLGDTQAQTAAKVDDKK